MSHWFFICTARWINPINVSCTVLGELLYSHEPYICLLPTCKFWIIFFWHPVWFKTLSHVFKNVYVMLEYDFFLRVSSNIWILQWHFAGYSGIFLKHTDLYLYEVNRNISILNSYWNWVATFLLWEETILYL